MKFLSTILSCLSLLSIVQFGLAQNIDGLRNQRELISDHIQLLGASLEASQGAKSDLVDQYQLIQTSIDQREVLGELIIQELGLLDSLIEQVKTDASSVTIDESWRKTELAELVRKDYYNQLFHSRKSKRLMHTVDIGNVVERQYNNYLQTKILNDINRLSRKASGLKDSLAKLELLKREKEEILIKEEQNLKDLQSNIDKSQKLIQQMQSDERRLQDDIDRQKNAQRKVNEQIRQSINNSEHRVTQSMMATNPTDFQSRKGNLNWPVLSGVVTKPFGELESNQLSGIRYKNNGIDMACPSGSKVHAIYDGTVIMSGVRAPYQHVVIINHGVYTTAYFHLAKDLVSINQVVKAGEIIGELRSQNSGAPFHFEIWYQQKQIDPEQWLRKR